MLCPRPTPLNRRPTVQNYLTLTARTSRAAGSFPGQLWSFVGDRPPFGLGSTPANPSPARRAGRQVWRSPSAGQARSAGAITRGAAGQATPIAGSS